MQHQTVPEPPVAIPPTGPSTGSRPGPQTWPAAQTLTVDDPLCGHLPGECWGNSVECAYWRGVALGEYPHPDAYVVTAATVLPPHAAGLLPLTDPALRSAA